MKKCPLLIIIALYFQSENCLSAPIFYHVDNTHSSIQFTVPFFSVTEVAGRFDRFCGRFYYEESNIGASWMELFIDASSVNTSLKIRDRDLIKSYFESDRYPVVYFKSTTIVVGLKKQFEVVGDLSLHGIKRQIKMTLTTIGEIVNDDGSKELGLRMSPISLNRTDYKIMEGSMGSGSVGDTVTTMALIRLRDRTLYRKEFDNKYQEKIINNTFGFSGSYSGKASKRRINLITDGDFYFMSFDDGDWQWLDQAKPIGLNKFKLVSFNHIIEIKGKSIIYQRDDKTDADVFVKDSKN